MSTLDAITKTSKTSKTIKIKANCDIDINGRIYFIPDKHLGNLIYNLGIEHQILFKYIMALYLDLLITNHKIENVSSINKTNITDACLSADKLISYITTGKIYISYINNIEKMIIEKIPETLLKIVNPNIIEKLEN